MTDDTIRPISDSVEFVGRHIKTSKVKHTWTFESHVRDKAVKVELFASKAGKRRICVNSSLMKQSDASKSLRFSYAGLTLEVVEEKENEYDLLIGPHSFSALKQSATSVPTSSVPDTDAAVFPQSEIDHRSSYSLRTIIPAAEEDEGSCAQLDPFSPDLVSCFPPDDDGVTDKPVEEDEGSSVQPDPLSPDLVSCFPPDNDGVTDKPVDLLSGTDTFVDPFSSVPSTISPSLSSVDGSFVGPALTLENSASSTSTSTHVNPFDEVRPAVINPFDAQPQNELEMLKAENKALQVQAHQQMQAQYQMQYQMQAQYQKHLMQQQQAYQIQMQQQQQYFQQQQKPSAETRVKQLAALVDQRTFDSAVEFALSTHTP